MSRHANRTRWTRSAELPRSSRIALNVTGAVALIGLALGALAWATPTHQTAATSTRVSQQLTFSYTAEVPLSAAYDSTTLHSPDPVFRRLTNTVDLHLSYRGTPGTLSVAVELSTPSGWHSTVPLAGPTQLAGTDESTVALDLAALDSLAQSAAAVTGLPAGPVTITVQPRVETPDHILWTPTLALNLTPLQLTAPLDPSALTVAKSITVTGPALTPRTLGLPGLHVTVTQARAVSVITLGVALLAAALLVLLGLNTPPVSEGTGIRRRYSPLLAAIDPMTSPAHLPVIEVATFATLAKIAERYGLLVMHWSRSDVETFVVLDEGATYRYRAGAGSGRTLAPATGPTDRDLELESL